MAVDRPGQGDGGASADGARPDEAAGDERVPLTKSALLLAFVVVALYLPIFKLGQIV